MARNGNFPGNSVNPVGISQKQWAGFVIVFAVSWIVSIFLWQQFEIDKSLLFYLNNSNFSDTFLTFNRLFSRYGMPLTALIYLGFLIATFKYDGLKDSRPVFLLIIFSFAIAGISGDLLKEAFNRIRPIVEYSEKLTFFTGSGSPSFPSGHATKVTGLVLPFLFFMPITNRVIQTVRYVLALTALFVCLSRVVLGAHYVSDVLAGVGLTFLSLPLAVKLSNVILKKMTPERYETASKIWILVYIGLIILLMII